MLNMINSKKQSNEITQKEILKHTKILNEIQSIQIYKSYTFKKKN